jgi:hypothetical protein
MAVPGAEIYAAGVARTGWGQRIVRVCRWEPRTYRQVWLGAPLGWGVPGFIIWSVIGHRSPYESLTYALVIAFGGLVQSWQLNRRRQRGL